MDNGFGTIILKVDDINITTHKAVIGSKSYDISTVKSVCLEEKKLSPIIGNVNELSRQIDAGMLSCVIGCTNLQSFHKTMAQRD